MTASRMRIVTFVAVLSFAPSAFGQGGQDGSIIGYVMDQTGSPIKGVKVVATSPTQIGGAKTAYTNEEGAFRLRQLFPGTFEVRASAPKLKTVIQREIKVGITAPAELSLVLEVESGGVEEVKVVERAPTVSTTKSNVKEVYDLDFVESMPFNSRDQVFNQMVGQIGGAVGTRVRGGAGNQTIFTQDGFDMRDQYPVTKASAAYEIQSAGYGADNATASGGLVNLVTKTGSNKLELEFNATFENDALRLGKDSRDGRGNYYYVINPAIAGPIVRDKLWYAFTFESHWLGRGRDRDAEGILPDPLPYNKGINKGTLKLTWQINSRNKLSHLMNFDSAWERNMRNDLGVEQEAQTNRRAGLSGLWGLIWEAVLTDDLVLRVQGAYSRRPQHWYPWNCEASHDPDNCDFIPRVVQKFPRTIESNSNDQHERWDLDVYQASSQLQWFLDSKAVGEHSLVLKDQYYTEVETRRFSKPGDALYEYNGPNVPEAKTVYYSNDPRYEAPRYGWWIATDTIARNNASLSDIWKPTRHLTITPAISYVWARGSNGTGDTVMDTATWAPSLTAAWDATHDGRTVVRGGYSNYVDIAIRDPVLHTLGSQASQRCKWNSSTSKYDKDCVFGGGLSRNTFGSPCGPTGIDPTGQSCLENLKVPRTFEYTIGAEREIVQGVGLAVDVIYRKFGNQYERSETNRIWDPSGSTVVGYRNGRSETVMDMSTPDGAQRQYAGVTTALNKREGRVKAYVSYTWSQLRGTVFNGSNNAWGDIPGRDPYLDGYLDDDHRHDLKASMQTALTTWLSLGIRYSFQSGFPYNRLFRNDVSGSYENYRAERGVNPNRNLNDPTDDRELRLPTRQEVNAQVRLNLLPLIGQKLDFYVDALNILNSRTPTGYGQNDGTNFGVETAWMSPFRIRLGLNYRY
jgi:hypothetical protein